MKAKNKAKDLKKAAKKIVPEKVDGLSLKEVAKIRNAVRRIWQQSSYARKLCVVRSTDDEGYPFCEKCKKRQPKVKIDHVVPVGDILDGGIRRMFVSSDCLQALCNACHKVKTKVDNAKTKVKKKSKIESDDFF